MDFSIFFFIIGRVEFLKKLYMKITLFGLAGSGTSTVWKLLAQSLGYRFMSSGNIMRSWAKEKGMDIYEFEDKVVKEDADFDIKLDEKVQYYGKHNDNFVFESRLAWNFIPDSFKILLDCSEDTRYARIHKREGGAYEHLVLQNTKRESELVERYAQVYPDISFPPTKELFDLCVDANTATPNEIINFILDRLDVWKSI